MKIKQFDRPTCKSISHRVTESLKNLGEELGVNFKVGNGRFDPKIFTIKLEAVVLNGDKVESVESIAFKREAHLYGLKPEDLERKFIFRGDEYSIHGLRTRCYKAPIICRKTSSGKLFKFDEATVKMLLK